MEEAGRVCHHLAVNPGVANHKVERHLPASRYCPVPGKLIGGNTGPGRLLDPMVKIHRAGQSRRR